MIDESEFQAAMNRDGLVIFPNVIASTMLEKLRPDFDHAYDQVRQAQKRNGLDFPNSAHHIITALWRGSSFYDLLENLPLKAYMDVYFGGPYILNTISAIPNIPGLATEYENLPHRDMRSYFPVRLSLNIFIFLDNFTEDNGATYFYRGSHLKEAMPTLEEFNAHAERMVGPAGSIAVFNSDLVHAGGKNLTDKPRRGLSYTLVRPFMKQQCQYHTLISDGDSEWMKQLLGYNARTPKNLDEWYQPPERRMYKPGQG